MKENLSIIIPCKNERDYIIETLKSIDNQTIFVREVLVLDGESTDGTVEKVKEYAKTSKNKIVVAAGGTVSVGRNNGAKIAKGDLLLFLDADAVLLDENILKNAVQSLQEYKLIGAKIKSTNNNLIVDIIFKLFFAVQSLLRKSFCPGIFMMVTKKTYLEIGGFDETLHQSEDYFFSENIEKRDFKILNSYVGQDDRRFKKIGYFGMVKLLITNFLNIGDKTHFKKNIGYWD